MSWTRYLLNDFFTARELNEAERHRKTMSRQQRHLRRNLEDRIADLEEDVGQVALIARTVVEVLLRKGLVPREEFDAILADVDKLDGKLDGRLDPDETMPPPELPEA